MTPPIKPMSAEEIISMSVEQEAWLRSALASHLAYVMEQMKPYEKEHIGVQGDTTIFAVNTAVQSCLAVLQSEINELTK